MGCDAAEPARRRGEEKRRDGRDQRRRERGRPRVLRDGPAAASGGRPVQAHAGRGPQGRGAEHPGRLDPVCGQRGDEPRQAAHHADFERALRHHGARFCARRDRGRPRGENARRRL